MVFLRHVGFALAGLTFFLSLVEKVESTRPSFEFPPCVGGCILDSDCLPSNGNCMCKRARGSFLEKVLKCMDTNCHADLRNYQDSFLDPLEDGCGERNQDLPASKLDAAKLLAKDFIPELPTTTTIISTSPSKVTSKSLTVETRPSSSVQEGDIPDPTTTSTVDRNNQPDSTSTSNSIAASSAQTSIPSPEPSPEPIPPPLTDTSPFTNNNFVSSGSQARPPFRMLELSLVAAAVWIGF